MTVEIFKTNVQSADKADEIRNLLLTKFPASKINFDLYDCDKILRVEGEEIPVADIAGLVEANGFECTILE